MPQNNQFLSESENLNIKYDNDDLSIREKLDQLAIELATNHCTVSFGEEEKKRVKLSDVLDSSSPLYESLKHQLGKNKDKKREKLGDSIHEKENDDWFVNDLIQHRNILVIGAGATYDSYKCIPLGQQVIDKFDEKYKSKIDAFPAIAEKFNTYKNELRLQNREPDFENMLSIYAELILTPNELRSEISELFNFRYSPSLFYEIVAHLFKHSFIDVIINFNFDEILDQVIEEELGKDNYYHILSDGDCVSIEDMMVDGRLKTPIYIKPHGTVGHKSTLRFTKRHYLDVPAQIRELLIQLIKGRRGDVVGRKSEEIESIQKINLISVGFNMASLEFCDILDEHLPAQSKIYHICYEKEDSRGQFFVNKVFPSFYNRAFKFYTENEPQAWDLNSLHKQLYCRIAVEGFNKCSDPERNNKTATPFAESFSYLWRRIFHLFKEDLTPRSIGRHEIVSYFFYDNYFGSYKNKVEAESDRLRLKQQYEHSIDYFLDRTIVEIAMAINRNNGIIEIAQLLGDRSGHFYKKYRDTYFRTRKTHKGAHSIYDLINQFVSEEWQKNYDTTYSKNIFQLDIKALARLKSEDNLLARLKSEKVLELKYLNRYMRRYQIQKLLKNEYGNPVIESTLDPIYAILNKFNQVLHSEKAAYDPVSIITLYRLFKVKYLSVTFINNFKFNCVNPIYNGNHYDVDDFPNTKVTVVDEIARLFLKSSRRHYYCIRPRFLDPKNYLTESFSKSRILHTNLSVEYAFRNLFLKCDWDIALLITETGSILNFLESKNHDENKFRNKKIIVLNSYDAIRQFHREANSIKEINEFQNNHYRDLLSKGTNYPDNVIHTFSLPSIQHNHHMMLFIKVCNPNENTKLNDVPIYEIKQQVAKIPFFQMTGALYVYRQGFSNNLNPLLLNAYATMHSDEEINSLTHDFKKLLRIFSMTFCRSLAFEGTKKIKGLDINLVQYQNWLPLEEVDNIDKFVQYLHNKNEANFVVESDSNNPHDN